MHKCKAKFEDRNGIDVISDVISKWWLRSGAAQLPSRHTAPPPPPTHHDHDTYKQSATSAETRSVPCPRVVCRPGVAHCVFLVLWSSTLCIPTKVQLFIFTNLFSQVTNITYISFVSEHQYCCISKNTSFKYNKDKLYLPFVTSLFVKSPNIFNAYILLLLVFNSNIDYSYFF